MTQAEMTAKLKAGVMQIHKFPLGFVVTEIKQYPEERVLIVQLLSGEKFEEWSQEVVDHLRKFAREHECKAVEAICRKGLEPILKPLGWKRTRVLLRDELSP